MRTLLVSILCAVALTSITGCGFVGFPGVYKINVEQGNIIDQEKVDMLKIGMSRRQVRFILGTPLVDDSFNQNRWDYLHTIRNGQDSLLNERMTVYFDGDKLSSIEGDFTPAVEEEALELDMEDTIDDDETIGEAEYFMEY